MPTRRCLLAGALATLAAPLAAEGQQAGKVYRIGVLDVVSVASNAANLAAFRQGLRELEYVEGQNFTIDYRSADGRQGKLLQVLREVVPQIARVAFLFNMSNPVVQAQWKEAELAARSAGLQRQLLDVRTARDLEPALDAAVRQRSGAVIVGVDALTQAHEGKIAEALVTRRLPAICRERGFVDAGGLMSYGVHYADLYRRAAAYVDKIFKGAKPADIPIEQPTKLELVINLKTAKALGLAIPASVLARADRVIK